MDSGQCSPNDLYVLAWLNKSETGSPSYDAKIVQNRAETRKDDEMKLTWRPNNMLLSHLHNPASCASPEASLFIRDELLRPASSEALQESTFMGHPRSSCLSNSSYNTRRRHPQSFIASASVQLGNEIFEKRPRRKTRPDKYDIKKRPRERSRSQRRNSSREKRPRQTLVSGKEAMSRFSSASIPAQRVTVRSPQMAE